MKEKTMIMDGSNPNKENEERVKVVNDVDFKSDLAEKQTQQVKKMNTLRNIALAGGGIGLGAVAMGFMPSNAENYDPEEPILVPDDPQQATNVNDKMSYNEAWQAAREEVGPGGYFLWHDGQFSTYTQEEWNSLDDEEQKEFEQNMKEDYAENQKIENDTPAAIVVHDTAPVAESVSDDMSFEDAFAMARQEVGPGGVFEWHGKLYNTYYKEEWNNMTAEDKHDFEDSYIHTTHSHSVHHTGINHVPPAEVIENESEIFVTDDILLLEDGTMMHVGYFVQGTETIVKLDVDNDNQYDYIVDDKTNQLIGLNGNQDVDMEQIFPSGSSVEPIMSEMMQINGYDALVTLYSDGHQEAQIDIDGDGRYDCLLSVDEQGNMRLYDNEGNLVDEEQMELDGGLYIDENGEIQDDIVDDQLENPDNFGDDFVDNGDVSGWIQDDLV